VILQKEMSPSRDEIKKKKKNKRKSLIPDIVPLMIFSIVLSHIGML
jgi:hypothetical protein